MIERTFVTTTVYLKISRACHHLDFDAILDQWRSVSTKGCRESIEQYECMLRAEVQPLMSLDGLTVII